ncbi:MAG TPA: NAD(P)-dependent alcohol dehydrogenase [Terriglobales bacterium]|nr:NAD(P)-dependent alcohol dehydrogenase [Terriglobales bacterium]
MANTVTYPEQELAKKESSANVPAFAAQGPKTDLAPFSITRREPGPKDVQIEILYCGVCHSDLHTARNEWQNTTYPVVPGHEIVGKVTKVGKDVKKFKEGDYAAVGCMVDSDRTCPECKEGLEQYCNNFVGTYNSPDKHLGGMTYGGYSKQIVVDEHFVLRLPDTKNLAGVAPLLCAGITTYSPLRHWKVGKGQKVGIVGLGGLGHMGLKLAHAMGANVTLFTTSPGKTDDAKRLGADEVVISKDTAAMEKLGNSFDFILDTVSAQHDINLYLNLLKRDATLVQVGAPEQPLPTAVFSLIFKRRNFAGSLIGGIAETQEMLDFCAKHNITSDVEIIPIQKINEAYERLLKSDVKYRFVIDLASLK